MLTISGRPEYLPDIVAVVEWPDDTSRHVTSTRKRVALRIWSRPESVCLNLLGADKIRHFGSTSGCNLRPRLYLTVTVHVYNVIESGLPSFSAAVLRVGKRWKGELIRRARRQEHVGEFKGQE